MNFCLSRRQIAMAMPAVAGAALLPTSGAQLSARALDDDLSDPHRRARVRARIMGSCGNETIFMFYRLNIYGFVDDRNLIPFFTMNNLAISDWQPQADGTFQRRTCEAGVYCRFDTDETLDEWINPLTGERRKVWHFKGGPWVAKVGPDGFAVHGAAQRTDGLRMERLGDMVFVPAVHGAAQRTDGLRMERLGDIVFVPAVTSAAYPNSVDQEKWPKFSSGPTRFWESQATFAAKAEDAFNERLTSAPAFCHFQNLPSWQPWVAMAGRPGRTFGNAHGAKLHSLDQIPLAARKGLESRTPEIFNWKSWTTPQDDIQEFLSSQRSG